MTEVPSESPATKKPKRTARLDTRVIPEESPDEGNIVDHERTFVPAGGISAEDLATSLRKEHPKNRYRQHSVEFRVDEVKNRVVVLIVPKKKS